ncbi:hypothetical protein D3C73_902200 [compost metagenome]
MFAALQVDLAQQHGGLATGFGDELALWAQHVAVAPELDARGAQRRRFMAHAVAAEHRHAVGHGMATVAQHPGVALAGLLVLHVIRVPADRGGVEQQFRTGQRHQPRRFRVPLVPAHQHAKAADRSVDRLEADVARGEVELFVETRVIGNVHLAVLAQQRAVLLEDHGGVVVQAGSAALEQRADQHHAVLLRQRAQALGARARDRLGQVEFIDRFVLAEVGAVV